MTKVGRGREGVAHVVQSLFIHATCVVTLMAGVSEERVVAQDDPVPLTFTEEQAAQGEEAYAMYCATCHGENLDDGEFAPPLTGVAFRERWRSEPPLELLELTRNTMPQDRPGRLDADVYADLVAFVYQENGSQSGDRALPFDAASLERMAAPLWRRVEGGGLAPGARVPPPPYRSNPLDGIRPVTDAMLVDAEPGAWLLWRRTYDAFGLSPLDDITASNVRDLRVAWSWSRLTAP